MPRSSVPPSPGVDDDPIVRAEYSFADTEDPTKPDGIADPQGLMLLRLYGEMAPIDRRKFARLATDYYTADNDGRILLEAMADRLAKSNPRST